MRFLAVRKVRAAALLAVLSILVSAILSTAEAQAAIGSPGNAALSWAETQSGKPYVYGTDGPWSYDCSGLVYTAFQHVGITLPRTTYGMLGSYHLHPIPASEAKRGDLAFYGSGHVEFVTAWWHLTFGAHDWGQPIGWIRYGSYWYPTMYFRVY